MTSPQKSHTPFKLASLMLAALVATSACGGNDSGTSTSGNTTVRTTGGALTVASPTAPTSLDPILGFNGGDHASIYPIFDRLVNFDPKTLKATPGLAESWTTPDPQTLVLEIRKGVKFQDGTPLDAEAVKFSLDRARQDKTSRVLSELANIDSIEATKPLEVTIHLKQPDASVLLSLADRAGMIVSPTAVKKEGADFALHPVGTGPYTFKKYVANDRLMLEKNKTYWQVDKTYLDQITFKYFTDQQTSNNALRSHQVDVVLWANLSDVAALKQISDVKVVSGPSLETDGCYFNFTKPPFDKVEARLAVAYAIDRDALNKSYAFGLAAPTSSLFPKGYWAADPKLDGTFKYDPERAKELLAKAGYPDGLTFKGMTVQNTGMIRKNEVIQHQLKKVGINMTFDAKDPAAAGKAFFADKAYDMVCTSFSGRPDPGQTANTLLPANSYYNNGGYDAPGMADALKAAAAAQTEDARAAALSKVLDLNQQYNIWMPLLSAPTITAFSDKVQGLTPNLYGKVDVSFLSIAQ